MTDSMKEEIIKRYKAGISVKQLIDEYVSSYDIKKPEATQEVYSVLSQIKWE